MIKNKIVTKDELREIVEKIRQENPEIKIVTTNGAFDIIHTGHVDGLIKAKQEGDILIVGLNSDSSIKQYKSLDRPINPQQNRAKVLAALECVDYVTVFDETDPRELLKLIKPDIHVKSKSGFKGIEREVVEQNGGKIILIEDIPGLSTTNILKKYYKTI